MSTCKKVGKILWWGEGYRTFGIIEVKKPDFSVETFFLHRKNVIKLVPDKPAADHIVVFDISAVPQAEGKLPLAVNAEVYASLEEALRSTAAVSGVSR
jgi:hypothetical protein